MTDEEEVLTSTPRPHVLQITLNRPKALNALNGTVLETIANALTEARDNEEVRCVVITGGEKVFAAGADIKEFPSQTVSDMLLDQRAGYWETIRSFPKPMVAAINGYALGGGCELAMHADIMIAGETATFGQPEVNLGIIPGAGGTQRLTKAVGKSLAMKMVIAGEFIDAKTALQAGLVAEVTPKEMTIRRALDLAETIGSKPPLAARLGKQAVNKALDMTLENGLEFERRAFAALFGTEDKAEGVAAFIEKRKGNFKGR
jgi:enoyl-CoA hydratase